MSMYVRHHQSFSAHSVGPDEVCLGTGVLDGLFDHVLNFIPIASIDTVDDALEVLLNLAKHLPLVTVGNERDGHTNATKAASTTDTVKICLEVGCVGTLAASVFLRDILKGKLVSLNNLPREID